MRCCRSLFFSASVAACLLFLVSCESASPVEDSAGSSELVNNFYNPVSDRYAGRFEAENFLCVDDVSGCVDSEVLTDRQTGVQYLAYRIHTYGLGVTPLYNADGSLCVDPEFVPEPA